MIRSVLLGTGSALPARRVSNAELAEHGQHVAFDAARVADGATVGGLVSTGDGGPGALVHGTLRDLVDFYGVPFESLAVTDAASKAAFERRVLAAVDEHDIELRTETVAEAIDLNAREVALAGGERVPFHSLLLATGAEPRRLPGAEDAYYLRDFGDSDTLRGVLDQGGRMAVIGGGWIGSEVAASARQKGLEVG